MFLCNFKRVGSIDADHESVDFTNAKTQENEDGQINGIGYFIQLNI